MAFPSTLSSSLRILFVIASMDPADGGPPESMRTLTRALGRLGHRCAIVTLDSPSAPWMQGLECPLYSAGPATLGRYRYSPSFRRWLEVHVREYDVVVVNGIFLYTSLATRSVCRRQDVPYAVLTHGSLDPWFRRRYPLKHLKKWLYWPWGDYRVLRDAERVLFTTEAERELAAESFWLYRVRPTVVGYGTSDPPAAGPGDREELLSTFPVLRDRRVLLFMSRIDRKKGCQLLIEAFAKTAALDPRLLLVMAGPDSTGWRTELERQAATLGIADRILWTGTLAGARKWAALRLAEALVLTSHTENFGIVVVEAMAVGTPVLISQRVNIWREVVQAGAGYAADDTVAGSEDLLRRWHATDAESRAAMSRAARCAFEQQFEIGHVALRLDTVLRECAMRAQR